MDATLCADAPADPEIVEAMAMSDHAAGPRVAAARVRAENAHRKARVIPGVGYRAIDWIFESAQRQAGGQAAQAQLIAFLRGAIKLEAIIADPSMAPTKFAQDQADAVATAGAAAQQLRSLGLDFDAVKQVLNWRARGLAVTLAPDGAVLINPKAALNAVDLDLIRGHKAALVGVLRDVGVF